MKHGCRDAEREKEHPECYVVEYAAYRPDIEHEILYRIHAPLRRLCKRFGINIVACDAKLRHVVKKIVEKYGFKVELR